VFNEEATELSRGASCRTSFGLPPSAPTEIEESIHPLMAERWFFHFPQQELYINFDVPAPPRNWQDFTLCLNLDSQWPAGLILNEEIFQLFAVPAVNMRRALGQPIICDGTQERYPIRHPQPEHRFELHSVLGVYEINSERRMVPLRAGVISGGSGSYEIDQNTAQSGSSRIKWLMPHFPESFASRKTLVVDGLWFQPWYSDAVTQRQRIQPYDRTLVGVKWDWLGSGKPHAVNTLLKQTDAFTHVFMLANKSVLNVEDIAKLLRALGTVRAGEFRSALRMMAASRVESVPHQKPEGAGLIRHVYHLLFNDYDPALHPLMETFVGHVERVLDAWISDAAIEAVLETVEKQARIKGTL
jgi:type VI secretion system protein ImpG